MAGAPTPLAQLESLGARLRDRGFDTLLKYGQDEVPDQLFADLEPDAQDRPLYMQLMFYPGPDDPGLVQAYIGLPYAVHPNSMADLARFLNRVNANLPVGGFGYLEEADEVYFRHNSPVHIGDVDADLIGYVLQAAQFVLLTFGPLLEAVAGGLGFDEATRQLSAQLESIPGII